MTVHKAYFSFPKYNSKKHSNVYIDKLLKLRFKDMYGVHKHVLFPNGIRLIHGILNYIRPPKFNFFKILSELYSNT